MADTKTIGELAAEHGLTLRALRFWEQKGLLAPTRLPSGARLYDPEQCGRVRLIVQWSAAGFRLHEIRWMLGAGTGRRGQYIDHRIPKLAEAAQRRIEAIDRLRRAA